MALDPALLTEPTRQALAVLRPQGTLHWGAVWMLVATMYFYGNEIAARRPRVVAAGLALWAADWINEILNCVVLHATGRAALWTETGGSFYLVLIGLNVESIFLFALYGLIYAKMLPADRHLRVGGLNNRLALALFLAAGSVATEVVLVKLGVFHWYWPVWNIPWGLPVIFLVGYVWFFLAAAWAHDAPTERAALTRAGALWGIAAGLALVVGLAGWL